MLYIVQIVCEILLFVGAVGLFLCEKEKCRFK